MKGRISLKLEFATREETKTSSAFLIAEVRLGFLEDLRTKASLGEILHRLLCKYRKRLILWKGIASRRLKTQYQEKGLDLVRVPFIPENEDWLLLGAFAIGLGLSRSKLFSILLDWEKAENEVEIEGSSEKKIETSKPFGGSLYFGLSFYYYKTENYARRIKYYRKKEKIRMI